MSGDWDKLTRAAADQGWRVERRSRHIWLWAPGGGTVSLPTSPGDHRSIHNCVADMRRLGFVWRGRGGASPPPPPDPAADSADVSGLAIVEWALNADELLYDAMVRAQGPLSVTELAAATGLSRSSVQLVAESLAQAGFLQRAGFRSRAKRGVRPEPLYELAGSRGA